jgi:hypothetical protein
MCTRQHAERAAVVYDPNNADVQKYVMRDEMIRQLGFCKQRTA